MCWWKRADCLSRKSATERVKCWRRRRAARLSRAREKGWRARLASDARTAGWARFPARLISFWFFADFVRTRSPQSAAWGCRAAKPLPPAGDEALFRIWLFFGWLKIEMNLKCENFFNWRNLCFLEQNWKPQVGAIFVHGQLGLGLG